MFFTIKTVVDGPACQEFINNLDGSKLFCERPENHSGPHKANVKHGELSWEPKPAEKVQG